MKQVSCLDPVLDFLLQSHSPKKLILVAGCSRVGKSHLSTELKTRLAARGKTAHILSLDSWIVDVDKRPPHSRVTDRFNLLSAATAVSRVLAGQSAQVPEYNAASRKQVSEGSTFRLQSDYLILEGVLAFLISEELRSVAAVKIFVEIQDDLRRQRLREFYLKQKGFSTEAFQALELERENEEVPFVKETQKFADFIYYSERA